MATTFKEIPPNLGTKSQWIKRGYKVIPYARIERIARVWNGLFMNKFKLFHISDTECINGEKARIRRRTFHHEWLEATESECS